MAESTARDAPAGEDPVVLGIETTCDETSVAIVTRGPRLLAQVLLSQTEHRRYGGVVPEIASRSHVESLTRLVEQCLAEAQVPPERLSAIAVAHRPGLIGALLIGVTTAKALAWAWGKPLVAVHHLHAHLEAAALGGTPAQPPFLGVVLSGGHSDIYEVGATGRTRLGRTQDDAMGEAFDKVAAVLGLPYPGGPAIDAEAAAAPAGGTRVALPRTLLGPDSLDFSFSGLKTAVLYAWRGQDARRSTVAPDAPPRAALAAAFQEAVADVLIEKLRRALARTGLRRIVFGGGVTANRYLRGRVLAALSAHTDSICFPEPEFATDNGAMIAAAGLALFERGETVGLELEASASA